IPPTMALVLWKLDRKADAVAWYGAAVRTEPLLWTDARNYATLLPAWQQEDRDTLAEVLGAWQANPPRWP
ncbi:MAG TPA: tetratricopeptide repeat protein, partial [Pseudoxanthomonas sp.]